MSRGQRTWCAVLAAAAVWAAPFGCAGDAEETFETSEQVPVHTVAAARGTLRDSLRLMGTVTPAPGAELLVTAPQSARIAELPRAEGDAVRKGDLLVRFEVPSLEADLAARQADLARAQAGIEPARAASERAEGLLARGIAARKEVEDAHRDLAEAQAALGEAEAAVASARSLQGRERVVAPFDGVVAGRWHQPGDLVDAATSDPVLRLIDPSALEVEVPVPVSDLARAPEGASAQVIGPGAQPPEEATVRSGFGAADPATGAAKVRLRLAKPTRLPVGTPVQVILFGAEHRDVLLVPEAAVVHEGTDRFLITVDAEGRARRHRVEIGIAGDGQVEILSGIAPGEAVIVRGQEGLPDGAAVIVAGS